MSEMLGAFHSRTLKKDQKQIVTHAFPISIHGLVIR
jgi:hypothetical protein